MGQTLSEPVTEKVCSPRPAEPRKCAGAVGPRPGIDHGPHTDMNTGVLSGACLVLSHEFESEQLA